jgi:hypothetical protein
MVNQQTPGSTNNNTQPSNNNNLDISDSVLRSTFVLQPDASTSMRNNETLRSRSADSRPINTNTAASTTTSSIEDDDADWIDLPSMDLPIPPTPPAQQQQQLPHPPILPMPRIRGSAIIRKFLQNKTKDYEMNIFYLFYFRINRSKFTLCITLFYSNTSSTF